MASCNVCGKTFKNLRLHTVKSHEEIRVKSPKHRGDDDFWEYVSYAGARLEFYADYHHYEEDTYTHIFTFPKSHPLHNYSKFDGIGILFTDMGFVREAFYIKMLDERKKQGEWKEVGKIYKDRVIKEL